MESPVSLVRVLFDSWDGGVSVCGGDTLLFVPDCPFPWVELLLLL
jgi:hypothetical protein